ncbi:MAG: SLC13 family permease [Anaerolineales bacterium]
MTLEMWLVIAVIVFPSTLVPFNRWRIDVAPLFMIVALRLAQFFGLGILSDKNSPGQTLLAISGFGQPVVVTLIGLFILTQTLTNNGVMLWLSQRLMAIGASSTNRLIFLFSFSSAALSLLMNNVAVGALLLPSVMQVARKPRLRPSKFLIPMAHPVNLVVMGPGNYRFGDFFRVGWGLATVVFLTLLAGMILFWHL